MSGGIRLILGDDSGTVMLHWFNRWVSLEAWVSVFCVWDTAPPLRLGGQYTRGAGGTDQGRTGPQTDGK